MKFVVDTRFVAIVADGFDAGIRVFQNVPRDMIAVKFGPGWKFVAVASPLISRSRSRQRGLRRECGISGTRLDLLGAQYRSPPH